MAKENRVNPLEASLALIRLKRRDDRSPFARIRRKVSRKRSLEPPCASDVIKAGTCAGLAQSARRKGFDSWAGASLG